MGGFGTPAKLLVSALAIAWAGSAFGGLFDDEEARKAILDLRQKVETLRSEFDQKLADEVRRSSEEALQLRRSLADLQNQLEAQRSELAKLRGQDEQLLRDLAELQRRQKDIAQGFDDRIRRFEPAKVAVDGREFLADLGEKRDFEAAMQIFRKGEFAGSQVSLVDFLNRYPNSGYRPSALFWLGNAQYALKDYKNAVTNFRSLIAVAPDHLRVPESMLAIANCLLELKDTKAARKMLEDLVAAHGSTEAAGAAKDRLSRFK